MDLPERAVDTRRTSVAKKTVKYRSGRVRCVTFVVKNSHIENSHVEICHVENSRCVYDIVRHTVWFTVSDIETAYSVRRWMRRGRRRRRSIWCCEGGRERERMKRERGVGGMEGGRGREGRREGGREGEGWREDRGERER